MEISKMKILKVYGDSMMNISHVITNSTIDSTTELIEESDSKKTSIWNMWRM
ncbi:hypothetical protein RhiirC2_759788 [Rhizophagus irregularis]|uniref:Uncharacterized protein n=1 Tax=Rhizophagus irregularis TaxID=588596 RepID=A0A2N1MKS4_9GLOM|nr:hypothetical protein RhiirC2_759788 [Rhizophagus irregularis]